MRQLLSLLLVLFSLNSIAQNTMYFMDRLPQSISYNPAIMPKVKFFVGFPGIGGVSAQAYNSGFNMNELDDFVNNLDNDSYNPDKFVKSIGDYNIFSGEVGMNVFSFGFKLKEKNYLSFQATMNSLLINKASSDIAYLMADLDNLSLDDFPIVIDDISLESNTYLNFGVTYSRKITKNLTLGVSPKISYNQAGIKTSNLAYKIVYNDQDINPDKDEYEQSISGDVFIGLPAEINPNAIDNGELDMDETLIDEDFQEDINVGSFMQNKSLMVDIGAVYEIKKWTFSASLLNLGGSAYQTNGYKLSGKNDKILVTNEDKIKIGIPAKFYVGAMHQFSPKWNYALLFNNNFYSTGSVTTATASLNGYIGRMLSTSISYTAGYKHDNLGIGLRLRFFPGMDLYFVTDNILQAFDLKNAYRLTAAAGINIAFGLKDDTKVPDDLQLETK